MKPKQLLILCISGIGLLERRNTDTKTDDGGNRHISTPRRRLLISLNVEEKRTRNLHYQIPTASIPTKEHILTGRKPLGVVDRFRARSRANSLYLSSTSKAKTMGKHTKRSKTLSSNNKSVSKGTQMKITDLIRAQIFEKGEAEQLSVKENSTIE